MFLQADVYHSALRLVILDGVSILIAPLLDAQQSQGEQARSGDEGPLAPSPGHAMMTHLAATIKSLAYDHSIAAVVGQATPTTSC